MTFPTTARSSSGGAIAAPRSRWSLLGALFGVLAACGPDGPRVIHGTGPVVRELRDFLPLQRIQVEGYTDLAIEALPMEPGRLAESSGPGTFVYLEGAEDLLPWVETDVSGDTLIISFREGVRLDPLPSIEVQVGYLVELTSYGSGDIRLTGLTPRSTRGEPLELQFTGSADLHAQGEVHDLQVEQIGSGNLDLRGLESRSADYSGLGSGEVWVYATESVKASVKGSGDLYVHGPVPDGSVDASVLGGAKVIRVHD